MKSPITKIIALKKYFAVFIFATILAISPVAARPADAWLEIPGQFLKQALEVLARQMEGIMRGVQKQGAAQAIMQQVSSLVGGSGGSGPMFITDFRDYLMMQPKSGAKIYINDFISRSTQLRGSTNYEGFGGAGGNGSYVRQLTQLARQSTSEFSTPQMSYRGDPKKMFTGGNFKDMSLYLSGINNPWAFKINSDQAYISKFAELAYIGQTKSVSGTGFLGNEKDGKTITPGSLTRDMMANAQDLGNKILASATSMPEIITSVVSSTVTQALKTGIGMAESYVKNKAAEELQPYSGYLNTGLGAIDTASKAYDSYNAADSAAKTTTLDKKAYCAGDNRNDPSCK